MPVSYTNRRGQTYHLHAGKTKAGKSRYWFSMKPDGPLVGSIPEGHEVYENPDAQVFLRKIVPRIVTPTELAVVEGGLRRYAPGQDCLVEVKGEHIVVYHAERVTLDLGGLGLGVGELPPSNRGYMKVMKFTLVDQEARTFRAQRWCFLGSIDRWIDLPASGGEGKLKDLVGRFCRHIGRESFFGLS